MCGGVYDDPAHHSPLTAPTNLHLQTRGEHVQQSCLWPPCHANTSVLANMWGVYTTTLPVACCPRHPTTPHTSKHVGNVYDDPAHHPLPATHDPHTRNCVGCVYKPWPLPPTPRACKCVEGMYDNTWPLPHPCHAASPCACKCMGGFSCTKYNVHTLIRPYFMYYQCKCKFNTLVSFLQLFNLHRLASLQTSQKPMKSA
jgi:hypothetical protein